MEISGRIQDSALQGLSRAENRIRRVAQSLAAAPLSAEEGGGEVNLAAEMVSLLHAQRSYEASLKIIQAGDEMERHTIDVLG